MLDASDTFAALDLGTTNCRLLIARPQGYGAFRVVDSFSRLVRLGEGLDASGVLSEAAMARSIAALQICDARTREHRVTRARFVATEACRRAANGPEFLARVEAATGIRLEIIPVEEEAGLALAGCAPLLDAAHPYALVFDIGGGSSEVTWVGLRDPGFGRAEHEILGVVSVPWGVVSLTERFAGITDNVAQFDAMIDLMRPTLERFSQRQAIGSRIARGLVQMLGSSGTVTTLAAMRQGLPRYVRARVDGTTLDFATIAAKTRFIVDAGPAGRAAEPCIGPTRSDLMVAGCAILAAICRTWPVGKLRVADRGVREGILARLIAADRPHAAAAAPVMVTRAVAAPAP